MPTKEVVEKLEFEFDDDWRATKYDDWSFYQKRFKCMRDGIKAVDLIALSPDKILWLIEVKDYRAHPRTKPISIETEMLGKVFDTLAALLPACTNGDDADETSFARAALATTRIRVVLHLEQPKTHSKLFPRVFDPANVLMKLRKLVKAIDAQPMVVDMTRPDAVRWRVRAATP